jgi:uncharacterized protein YlxW (UPF0749 family)
VSEAPGPPLLPERVTMGLLPYLNAHAVDEDYQTAAEQRARTGAVPPRQIGRGGAAVLAIFSVLTITAAVQTSRNSGTDEHERQGLITQVEQRKAGVDAQQRTILRLQALTTRLERDFVNSSASSNRLLARVTLLSLRSGVSPATGPGVSIVADDASNAQSDRNKVLDTDLQKLVNGLWQAGAEAISINGQRLTALSAIRHAGTAITVNFVSLSRPYRVLAIGNPERLPTRFAGTTSGQAWLDLLQQVGLRFSMHPETSLTLPGAELPNLRYVAAQASTGGSAAGKGNT